EPEFRRGERRVIERLLSGAPIVLATGGGAYMDADTRALLMAKATTVWLRADLNTIWKRVIRRDTRPLLKRENPKQALADLEPEFRRGERRVIERLLSGAPIVLATGGGAYMDADTRALLMAKATTVWLRADLNTIWKRVIRRDTRPLLKRENPKQALADLE